MKSPGRRKMAIGFSFQRDDSGQVGGQGTVVLQRRNAYQAIGLRRPNRDGERRIRFS
ncbi:MAG: hypothetical protein AAF571_06340 [Verrucomicrobiota bacterium]